ncbi:MAG: sigma-70 family RNA polymerase sigma factor [Myxococcota bacterium]
MEDRDLLQAIAAGDRSAFAELFRRYAPRINGFLRQSLSASKAEELTQDVMLRIWRKAKTYDPDRAAPATWIFTIARNARTDALRRGGRPEPDPEDPVWVPSSPDAPDEEADKRDAEVRVREALDGLPPAQLEVLERAYLQGQTLAEVAEGLKIPLGTVKSRVRLAMERLRAVLPKPGT